MGKGVPVSPSSPQGRFTRHARAVGVLWCVFTLCFTIIVAVVFMQPHWVGTATDTGPGHIGLWRWCSTVSLDPNNSPDDVICSGELLDIFNFFSSDGGGGSSPNPGIVNNTPFKTAFLLVGLALLVSVLSLSAMSLFLCLKTSTVFHIAGWMQIIAGCLLGAAVCVYPLGFNTSEVRHLCGPTARQYNVGECSIRWAYVLAIIGVFDAVVLAALALVLATRTVKPVVESIYATPEIYKGELGNGAFMSDGASLAASRKSLNLQPVMMMPPAPSEHDTYGRHYHL
ncbi:LHFPL tetraspan subfamily member 5 protein [Hyalella azteca]|uniref:LHFPL tetraspan subfamily member 5 protein n=1 Tax=Hyalella azteca TaxID=294128 RepID=A0A979FQ06_HYAAZ|nr:LHFPL tetraspan subfamily member 5 protein [Hyalella azteca]